MILLWLWLWRTACVNLAFGTRDSNNHSTSQWWRRLPPAHVSRSCILGDFTKMQGYADQMSTDPETVPARSFSFGKAGLVASAWCLTVISCALIALPFVGLRMLFGGPEVNGWLIVAVGPVLGVALMIWLLVVVVSVVATLVMGLILLRKGESMHGLLTLCVTTAAVAVPVLWKAL